MRNLVILGVVGLVAQFVDGSLGMGFGVTSSTLLIAAGIAPAMASASIHFSEVGTTLISGFAHHKMGNVDWRTVAILAVPGGRFEVSEIGDRGPRQIVDASGKTLWEAHDRIF